MYPGVRRIAEDEGETTLHASAAIMASPVAVLGDALALLGLLRTRSKCVARNPHHKRRPHPEERP
jgi:hypothetical protein